MVGSFKKEEIDGTLAVPNYLFQNLGSGQTYEHFKIVTYYVTHILVSITLVLCLPMREDSGLRGCKFISKSCKLDSYKYCWQKTKKRQTVGKNSIKTIFKPLKRKTKGPIV